MQCYVFSLEPFFTMSGYARRSIRYVEFREMKEAETFVCLFQSKRQLSSLHLNSLTAFVILM